MLMNWNSFGTKYQNIETEYWNINPVYLPIKNKLCNQLLKIQKKFRGLLWSLIITTTWVLEIRAGKSLYVWVKREQMDKAKHLSVYFNAQLTWPLEPNIFLFEISF